MVEVVSVPVSSAQQLISTFRQGLSSLTWFLLVLTSQRIELTPQMNTHGAALMVARCPNILNDALDALCFPLLAWRFSRGLAFAGL